MSLKAYKRISLLNKLEAKILAIKPAKIKAKIKGRDSKKPQK